MFAVLGFLVGVYTLRAAERGEVHARSGIRWRMIRRDESPVYFWSVVVIYAGLAVALVTVF